MKLIIRLDGPEESPPMFAHPYVNVVVSKVVEDGSDHPGDHRALLLGQPHPALVEIIKEFERAIFEDMRSEQLLAEMSSGGGA